MVNGLCPQDAYLTDNPWCQDKVIVALSDGDPGITLPDYFHSRNDNLPGKLVDSISNDGIAVNTLCIYTYHNIFSLSCDDPHWLFYVSGNPLTEQRLLGTKGKDLLEQIASATGGKYYGEVR